MLIVLLAVIFIVDICRQLIFILYIVVNFTIVGYNIQGEFRLFLGWSLPLTLFTQVKAHCVLGNSINISKGCVSKDRLSTTNLGCC